MVVFNDFEFQIVSARDKIPFKEHKKGYKTYVEIEPDAEFFLSVRKVSTNKAVHVCTCMVDGKYLGYHSIYDDPKPQANFLGIFSRWEGVEQNKALKFVKTSFASHDNAIGSSMSGMGVVELDVYNGVFFGTEKILYNDLKALPIAPSTIKIDGQAVVTKKKNLRSGEGQHMEMQAYDQNAEMERFSIGHKLYSITLYYCATPGLIAVGVLPKPLEWEYDRKLFPSKMTAVEEGKFNTALRSVKHTRNGSEILELNDSDDDDNNSCDSNISYVGITDSDLPESKKARISPNIMFPANPPIVYHPNIMYPANPPIVYQPNIMFPSNPPMVYQTNREKQGWMPNFHRQSFPPYL